MIEFAWWPLFAALPAPWLVRRFLPPVADSGGEAGMRVSFFPQWQALAGQGAGGGTKRRAGRLLPWILWGLLVLAAARPQWLGDPVTLPASGRDLLMAVDISGSMETPDFQWQGRRITRLQAVQRIGAEFLRRREGDRVGLVLYGERSYLQTPLTFDRESAGTQLQEAEVGLAGRATAIGDAIGLSLRHLKERPAQSRVLVLLTDGASNTGAIEPRQAAKLAAEEGLRIFTVGIGAERMEIATLFGSSMVNPSAEMDEEALQAVAELTHGRYFRARNPEELEEIYREIDRLEPALAEHRTLRPMRALFVWPLAAALLLGFAYGLGRMGSGFLRRTGGRP